jgi:hypothetical protein
VAVLAAVDMGVTVKDTVSAGESRIPGRSAAYLLRLHHFGRQERPAVDFGALAYSGDDFGHGIDICMLNIRQVSLLAKMWRWNHQAEG